jgi:NAD(P)-dependent dehydrogenase (short-subunit alcohol dehydrogenase family)
VTGRIGRFTELPLEVLRQTLNVNILGTMLLSQAAVRRWQAEGVPGRIVNISSVASTLGAPSEYVHYAASKAAVDAFTIGLGKEVAPSGIRVNAVAPGTTFMEIHAAGGDPDRPYRAASKIPIGRSADAPEIARCVLWLLSPDSSYVTATILRRVAAFETAATVGRTEQGDMLLRKCDHRSTRGDISQVRSCSFTVISHGQHLLMWQ